MTVREKEIELFSIGCYIEYEFINNKGDQIRGVTTVDGKNYKLIYKRNKNNVFIIDSIMEV